jgi:hypothetical protein
MLPALHPPRNTIENHRRPALDAQPGNFENWPLRFQHHPPHRKTVSVRKRNTLLGSLNLKEAQGAVCDSPANNRIECDELMDQHNGPENNLVRKLRDLVTDDPLR